MLNYSIFLNDKDVIDKFAQYSKIVGAMFVIMGLLGIYFPVIMLLSLAMFFSGFLAAF